MFWLGILLAFAAIILLCLIGAALVMGGMQFGSDRRANFMPEPGDDHDDYIPGGH